MKNSKESYKTIKGWAIDAKDEGPTPVAMSEERPSQEILRIEVLKSNERAELPAVIGQTIPPQGISGQLRKFAFRYSESHYRHWLPLLLADRINEIEGIWDDLKKGKCPNIAAERGWKARWKYDRKRTLLKLAGVTAISLLAVRFCLKKY